MIEPVFWLKKAGPHARLFHVFAQPSSAPRRARSSRLGTAVAPFAAGAMGDPVAADIPNQATPEKQS
ncbi:MAG: hypothetical protein V1796_00765 [Pseudomonadota bacterium]